MLATSLNNVGEIEVKSKARVERVEIYNSYYQLKQRSRVEVVVEKVVEAKAVKVEISNSRQQLKER